MASSNTEMKKSSFITRMSIIAALFLFLILRYRPLMAEDFTAFIKWWFALLWIGIGFLPLTSFMFKRFRDKGWLFSKTIGLALSGWLVWFLSSFHIIKFTVQNCFNITFALIGLNIVMAALVCLSDRKFNEGKAANEKRHSYGKFSYDTAVSAALTELMFFAGFLFWTYLRCFKPEILGNTEKFMDYGLMTSIDKAVYMPAEDIWLSGFTINYYYLGQYLGVFVKRLSAVDIKDSYNLALMMIAGFAFAMPYSLMNQVTSDFVKKERVGTRAGKGYVEERPDKWYTVVVGVLAGLSVCFAGNMHYTVVNFVALHVPFVAKALSITRTSYWFPDATRYIGYTPDTHDKTIHEFPSYSFVLGDLHAHVINIMFVLTVMAILYTILQARRERMDKYRYEGFNSIPGYDIKKPADIKSALLGEVLTPQILMLGFFIGFFHMTNFWDFPIYFVVSGAIILFSNAVICKFRKEALFLTAVHAVLILLVSTIVSLPFKLTFKQISTSIALAPHHSYWYQLAVLWGLPVTCVIVFLVYLIKRLNRSLGHKVKNKKAAAKAAANRESISKFCDSSPAFDWLYRFINSMEITDLFVLTLGLCAIGLVLMPELIYVQDIYSGDHKRANTMFKLTYQAFIMFGMCMPYIIARMIYFVGDKKHRTFGIVALCLLTTTFGYFFNASNAWFGDHNDHDRYQGLDCMAFMEDKYPEDAAAIDWLNENVPDAVHILEGVGFSYTYYGRVSVATGSATIMGWETHEWLWRSEANFNKPEIIGIRQKDVKKIYTSSDKEEVKRLLEEYDIDYIYVGLAERYDGLSKVNEATDGYVHNIADNYYYLPQNVNDELLRSLGQVIYQATDDDGNCINKKGQYMTYIVKVDKDR